MTIKYFCYLWTLLFIISCGSGLGLSEQMNAMHNIDRSTAVFYASEEDQTYKCSSVYIGGDFFLTNAHCILSQGILGHSPDRPQKLFPKEDFTILLLNDDQKLRFKSIEVVNWEYNTETKIDYALLKVPNSGAYYKSSGNSPPKVRFFNNLSELKDNYIYTKRNKVTEIIELGSSTTKLDYVNNLIVDYSWDKPGQLQGCSGAGVYSDRNTLLGVHASTNLSDDKFYANYTPMDYILLANPEIQYSIVLDESE